MSRNWDTLDGFEDWADVLAELMENAAHAVQGGSARDKASVQKELNEFVRRSPNSFSAPLDAVARATVQDIFVKTATDAVASISTRTAELNQLVKSVNEVTQKAQDDAASIRLESAKRVINSITDSVRNLADLRQVLSNTGADKLVAGQIDKAVTAINKLIPVVMNLRK